MEALKMDDSVEWKQEAFVANNINCYDFYRQSIYPEIRYQYHSCSCGDDKAGKAFKLATELMEKKLIKVDKVKDFVSLMNTLLEIL